MIVFPQAINFVLISMAAFLMVGLAEDPGRELLPTHDYWTEIRPNELKEFVESLIINGSVDYQKPIVKITEREVKYTVGRVTDSTYYDGSIINHIIRLQFSASLMRIYRPKDSRKNEIDRIESEIAKLLGPNKPSEEQTSAAVHLVHSIYTEKITEFAKSIGKEANITIDVAPSFEIEIITDPDDAIVEMMPSGDWELYTFLRFSKKREDVSVPSWITRPTGRIPILGGKHWLKVTWKDGQQFKKLVSIDVGLSKLKVAPHRIQAIRK